VKRGDGMSDFRDAADAAAGDRDDPIPARESGPCRRRPRRHGPDRRHAVDRVAGLVRDSEHARLEHRPVAHPWHEWEEVNERNGEPDARIVEVAAPLHAGRVGRKRNDQADHAAGDVDEWPAVGEW